MDHERKVIDRSEGCVGLALEISSLVVEDSWVSVFMRDACNIVPSKSSHHTFVVTVSLCTQTVLKGS